MNKPAKTWVITDTHFNHDAMVPYCGRPENHTEIILKNWRMATSPNDVTIHLGDVIIGRDSELKGMLEQVAGKKFLVMGNHDKKTKGWYMRNGFDFVGDGLTWRDIYFSHIPVETLPDGCTINVHGHFHNNENHDGTIYSHSKLLAIEYTEYKPVLFESLYKL